MISENILIALECRTLINELHRIVNSQETSPDFKERTRRHIHALSELVRNQDIGGSLNWEVLFQSVFTESHDNVRLMSNLGIEKLNLLISNLTFAVEANGPGSSKAAIETLCEIESITLARCR